MLRPPPDHVGVNPTNGDLIFICPLCNHDSSGHLQISVARGVWWCNKEGRGGSTLTLRRLTGIAWPCEREAPRNERALSAVLAAAFGYTIEAVDDEKKRVDYTAMCEAEWEISRDAADWGGLGNVSWLLSLCALADHYWTRGNLPPAIPWNVVAQAAWYLSARGFTPVDAMRWRLHVVCDPRLQSRRMYGRVVFPSWDPSTFLLRGFQARTIEKNTRPKYLSPQCSPLEPSLMLSPRALPPARTRVWRQPILVEGPTDAAALDRCGWPCAALCGKGAGDHVARELALYGAHEVTVLLDSGEDKAAHAVTCALGKAGIRTLVAHLPAGDPGVATAEDLRVAIADAQPPRVQDYLRAIRK